VAPGAMERVGSKAAIVLGLLLYCLQYCMMPNAWDTGMHDDWEIRALAFLGSISCGAGAGLVWTAEGVFFAESARRVAAATGEPLESKTTGLAAVFGVWSLGTECAVKVVGHVCLKAGFTTKKLFVSSLLLAFMATGATSFARPVHDTDAASGGGRCRRRLEALVMWADARIWLLSFLTVGFRLIVSLVQITIGYDFVRPIVGHDVMMLLSALSAGVGALMQMPLRRAAGRVGNAGNMALGSLAVVAAGALMLASDMQSIGLWFLAFYVVRGVIRGIWETTYMAVVANHFPDSASKAAFANLNMQAAISACLAWCLRIDLSDPLYCAMVVAVGCAIMPGFLGASMLQGKHKDGAEQSSGNDKQDERDGRAHESV